MATKLRLFCTCVSVHGALQRADLWNEVLFPSFDIGSFIRNFRKPFALHVVNSHWAEYGVAPDRLLGGCILRFFR